MSDIKPVLYDDGELSDYLAYFWDKEEDQFEQPSELFQETYVQKLKRGEPATIPALFQMPMRSYILKELFLFRNRNPRDMKKMLAERQEYYATGPLLEVAVDRLSDYRGAISNQIEVINVLEFSIRSAFLAKTIGGQEMRTLLGWVNGMTESILQGKQGFSTRSNSLVDTLQGGDWYGSTKIFNTENEPVIQRYSQACFNLGLIVDDFNEAIKPFRRDIENFNKFYGSYRRTARLLMPPQSYFEGVTRDPYVPIGLAYDKVPSLKYADQSHRNKEKSLEALLSVRRNQLSSLQKNSNSLQVQYDIEQVLPVECELRLIMAQQAWYGDTEVRWNKRSRDRY